MNIKFECFCGQPIEVNSEASGQDFKCPDCGAALVVPTIKTVSTQFLPPIPTQRPLPPPKKKETSVVGVLLFGGGLLITAGSLIMDTSVETSFGRVNNLGLMADRQNGLIIGFGLMIVGVLLIQLRKK